MENWNQLINAALLGTHKVGLSALELPDALSGYLQQLTSGEEEDKFLQIAALFSQYYNAGWQAAKIDNILPEPAGEETQPYCSAKAVTILQQILLDETTRLIEFWIHLCCKKGKLAPPQFVPALFEFALSKKNFKESVLLITGQRGKWLQQFNEDWKFNQTEGTREEIWQNGSMAERTSLLKKIREENPALALEWLRQTWPQENANARHSLLLSLSTGLSESDIPFLESLLNEKSTKVVKTAWDMLKQLPSSRILSVYQEILRNAFQLKKEKGLLSSKKTFEIQAPENPNEIIFQSGVEKMSSEKGVSDADHWLKQMMAYVPPDFWTDNFQTEAKEILMLFLNHKKYKFYLSALVNAVVLHRQRQWAKVMIEQSYSKDPLLLRSLEPAEKEKYAIQLLNEDNVDEICNALMNEDFREWSEEFSKKLLVITSKNPYTYNKVFYRNLIPFLNVKVADVLDQMGHSDQWKKNLWENLIPEVSQGLSLKQRIVSEFEN